MPTAIDSHSGNDHASAHEQPARPPDRRRGPSRISRRRARCSAGERRRQHALEPRHRAARAAPDRPRARTARRAAPATPAPADRARPLHPRERAPGWPRARSRPKTKTNEASSTSTVTMSSSRSRMIVANAPVALMRSCRARKYGRMTSPARAGSTLLAAKPTAVARNALAKRRRAERLEQILPAQRANRQVQRPSCQQRQRQPLAGARARSRRHAPEVDVVEKQRRPARPPAPARRRSEDAIASGLSALYYNALRRLGDATCCCCQRAARPCKMPELSRHEDILLPLASPILHTTLDGRPPDRQGKVATSTTSAIGC